MDRIDQLKTIPVEAFTEEDKMLLRKSGDINGVGGANLWKWTRKLMTQIFYYLDFEIHDINYWQISFIENSSVREVRRKKADFGILKYSWLGPIRIIEQFSLSGYIIKDILQLIYTFIVFLLNIIPMLLSPIVYIVVRIGGKKALRTSMRERKLTNKKNTGEK